MGIIGVILSRIVDSVGSCTGEQGLIGYLEWSRTRDLFMLLCCLSAPACAFVLSCRLFGTKDVSFFGF